HDPRGEGAPDDSAHVALLAIGTLVKGATSENVGPAVDVLSDEVRGIRGEVTEPTVRRQRHPLVVLIDARIQVSFDAIRGYGDPDRPSRAQIPPEDVQPRVVVAVDQIRRC